MAVVAIAVDRVSQLWRSPMVVVATLISAALAVVSAAVGAQEFAVRQQQNTNLVQQLVQNQLQNDGLLSGNTSELALRAVRPPNVAMILVRGRDLQMPLYADFSPAGSVQTRAPAADAGSGDLSTVGDLELIVRLIGGLLAIGLGVQTVMHHKQTGWLWALQGLPLNSWQLVLGQWIGCSAVVSFCAVACVGASVATAAVRVNESLWDLTAAMARALPTWLIYLGTMVAIGIAIASWTRRQVRAYGAMLLCWLGLAWLGPQFATAVSKLLRPLAPRLSMETERADEYENAVGAARDELGRLVSSRKPMNQLAADDVIVAIHDELDQSWQERLTAARQSALAREHLWNAQRAQQERLARVLLVWFPGALVSRGASEAADMGDVFAREWERSIAELQTGYNRLLFDDRPQTSFDARLGNDRGRQVFPFTRRPRPALDSLPLSRAPRVPPRTRRLTLIQTSLMLAFQLALALGIAMRVRPDRLRPAS